MNDVLVLETTDDMGDRGDFPNIGEKLISQTFTLVRSAHKSRDIHKFDRRQHDRRNPVALGEHLLQGV